ncbi:hypothetical protein [Polyangium sp. y55x31]|uniref:hypothetical protein n=1 Tax=Polyangium sp. y55x31 TaxID=3042688 RepID=UPI0024827F26|nr:hypothetical protein [Polyangium sp. y55x31]MDI1481478.1 hypothetical protein [Polyangium sp. y55x31]
MKTPQITPVHEAIDSAYERLVATLPEHLATVARDLPHRFGLTPNPGTPWSRVFNNAAVLGFPALLLGDERAPRNVRERAVEAHLFAIIAAFGMDRIDDGQIIVGAAERALIEIVRRARDKALAPLLAGLPEGASSFAWGERVTAESVEEERAVFAGRAPATLERYRAVSLKKQGLAFPASMAAAAAAGWSAEERRHVEALVAGAALGLQYRDDVVDWIDDFESGGSWPVALLSRAPVATVATIEQHLHAEGWLVRFLEMSSEAFHQAAIAAEALGAAALTSWAHGQSEQTAALAEREAASPGFAVRWERARRAQREQQQKALLSESPVTRAAG